MSIVKIEVSAVFLPIKKRDRYDVDFSVKTLAELQTWIDGRRDKDILTQLCLCIYHDDEEKWGNVELQPGDDRYDNTEE